MKFQCPSYPKTFSRHVSLKNHMKIHDTSKKWAKKIIDMTDKEIIDTRKDIDIETNVRREMMDMGEINDE
ncbi:hypothetical protein C1645_827895 [Glomus cerebriforme]|uniref:C2H2-type domain-containing protein n=1 Tax=Glomus cerebriforme TaxID=658196 RepID=A0A397STM8_9GLOM|nr:hypothetical protein C1645_827895 [Glomus cerebriforme]